MTPFGIYLESLRRSRGLRQKQLAFALGVRDGYISAMEKGWRGPPTKGIVKKLIESLKLSEQEQKQLLDSIDQSQTIRRLPKDVSPKECTFIRDLWQRLGTINEDQLLAMSIVLKMNQGGVNSQPNRRI